jgi:hypothetical protein
MTTETTPGRERYIKAEAWAFKAENPDARGPGETAESCAAIGQLHATLALAARDWDDTPVSAALRAAVDGLNGIIGGRVATTDTQTRIYAVDVLARVRKIRDGQT